MTKLTCPKCNSTEVFKDYHTIECDNCGFVSGKKSNIKHVFVSMGRRIPRKPDLEYYDRFS